MHKRIIEMHFWNSPDDGSSQRKKKEENEMHGGRRKLCSRHLPCVCFMPIIASVTTDPSPLVFLRLVKMKIRLNACQGSIGGGEACETFRPPYPIRNHHATESARQFCNAGVAMLYMVQCYSRRNMCRGILARAHSQQYLGTQTHTERTTKCTRQVHAVELRVSI